MTANTPQAAYHLSLVIPAHNEQDNLALLVEQIEKSLRDHGVEVELILVDDGSTDQTLAVAQQLMIGRPWVRVLTRGQCQGQSSAMFAGIQAASAPWTATLDADLQNDPADLLQMLYQAQTNSEIDMVQGDHSHDRKDSAMRRYASIVGRTARRVLLGDSVRDTGCSARVVRTDLAKLIPLQYKGMHRFVPVYVAALGGRIIEMPVNHRPRHAGVTKYGVGAISRGWNGLLDCFTVRWMRKRLRRTYATEAKPATPVAVEETIVPPSRAEPPEAD